MIIYNNYNNNMYNNNNISVWKWTLEAFSSFPDASLRLRHMATSVQATRLNSEGHFFESKIESFFFWKKSSAFAFERKSAMPGPHKNPNGAERTWYLSWQSLLTISTSLILPQFVSAFVLRFTIVFFCHCLPFLSCMVSLPPAMMSLSDWWHRHSHFWRSVSFFVPSAPLVILLVRPPPPSPPQPPAPPLSILSWFFILLPAVSAHRYIATRTCRTCCASQRQYKTSQRRYGGDS